MVSKASKAFKQMILNSYKYNIVKYKCGNIFEYSDNEEPRGACPICGADVDILKITFLEGIATDRYKKIEIYKDGKYE